MDLLTQHAPLIEALGLTTQRFAEFNGQNGANRSPQADCQIRAEDDYQAIACWLAEYQHKQTTYKAYTKEAERFLLWCIIEQQKPLSSVTRDDFEAYFAFIANPQPAAKWCGSRRARRGSPQWRPFVGPLGRAAQQLTIAALDSLFKYLVSAQYLKHNPLSLMRKKVARVPNQDERSLMVQNRILNDEEWQALVAALAAYPERTQHELDEKRRLQMIVYMLYFLGLRASELVGSTWRQFVYVNGHWWFWVQGKGDKFGKIPVHAQLQSFIETYLGHFYPGVCLEALANTELQQPIPGLLDRSIVFTWKGLPITARYINILLKKLAQKAAENLAESTNSVAKLQRFSAHWLRHLSATHQDKAGVPFGHIQQNLRHGSDATTKIYVHKDDELRHKAIQTMNFL